jgi:bifunctional non-homologous end joining protein LigD
MLRPSSRPGAFIEPCLPRPAKQPPTGGGWIHEIKHDGFRILAQRVDGRVRLLTRKGNNFASRFPQIVAAVTLLPVQSCLIDGEAIVCNEDVLAVFDLIREYRHDSAAVLCAFDLLELDGEDLRREPIETRKSTLKSLLRGKHAGSRSTRTSSRMAQSSTGKLVRSAARASCRSGPYRSGRADCWLKVKNPAAPAVTREAEENWINESRR